MKRRLTSAYVTSVKATNNKRLEIIDGKEAGLILRVSPSGAKTWAFVYRRKSDGKRRRYTIGNVIDISLHEARDTVIDLRKAVKDGGDPAGTVADKRTAITFSLFADEYIERYCKVHKRSWAADRQSFDRDAIPVIGHMKVSEVGKGDVLKILDNIEKRGATVLADRTFALLRHAFSWAFERDYVTISPCVKIRRKIASNPRGRVLDQEEIRRFWANLEKAPMEWGSKQILRLCLVTATRVGEVTGAATNEIDLFNKTWEIPSERSKNKRIHRVPLSPLALKLFSEAVQHSKSDSCVFPGKGTDEAQSRHAVTRAMNRALPDLQLENVTPHDLRRTAATNMGALGIRRFDIDQVLNHVTATQSSVTGQVYDKYDYEAEKRHALEAWAIRLEEILIGEVEVTNVVPLRG
jgi:integrase